jgi:hypothetical protein
MCPELPCYATHTKELCLLHTVPYYHHALNIVSASKLSTTSPSTSSVISSIAIPRLDLRDIVRARYDRSGISDHTTIVRGFDTAADRSKNLGHHAVFF